MKFSKIITGIFLVLLSLPVLATHNRAGEIIYRHLNGLNYEITVVTYTRESAPADRPSLPINFGDGSPEATIERISAVILGNDVKRNIYRITHTFNGPGTYNITLEDPNRNENVLNIPGSVNVVFFIEAQLTISPQTGQNNSVILSVPPIDDGCINQIYTHNPGAIDIDGDSLVYTLAPSLADGGQPAPGFQFPNQVFPSPTNNLTIEASTGTLIWDRPNQTGLYNVGILIEEYRNGFKVGEVLRDMQITILGCANTPPVISTIQDTCVEAGSQINFQVVANDAENTPVSLSATGLPFLVDNPAIFTNNTQQGFATGIFNWQTNCNNIRLAPYTVFFKATDNGNTPIPLVDFETVNIRVVPPSPKNPTVEPDGNNLQLNWDAAICDQAIKYDIYRRVNAFGFLPSDCETGVPAYTGFSLIGSTQGLNNTNYIDNNVQFGRNYCYMVVAIYPDGAESYASVEFCGQLKREVPAITKVSIGITDFVNGVDTIKWVHPTELDTLVEFLPPYKYQLYRGSGFTNATELVYESESSNFLLSLPTSFTEVNINTQDTSLVYRVDLLSGINNQVVPSSSASSVFLNLIPNDMQLEVVWNFDVTWDNFEYDVYKENSEFNTFELIGTTNNDRFIDTGLINGETYCYYVVSKGAYSISSLPDTLINFSQIICGEPKDLTPPCPPVLSLPENCEAEFNELFWSNPAETCNDLDTDSYNVYFKPTLTAQFELIGSTIGNINTVFTHNNNGSLAGCYYVTAIDSVGNESLASNILCVDNCPIIELPNVFTPNNDNVNDFFKPIRVRYIRDVEIVIYNRWGAIVHENTEGIVNWDGTLLSTGQFVSEGTYYYVATAKAIRLNGIEEIKLTGTITVFIQNNTKFD